MNPSGVTRLFCWRGLYCLENTLTNVHSWKHIDRGQNKHKQFSVTFWELKWKLGVHFLQYSCTVNISLARYFHKHFSWTRKNIFSLVPSCKVEPVNSCTDNALWGQHHFHLHTQSQTALLHLSQMPEQISGKMMCLITHSLNHLIIGSMMHFERCLNTHLECLSDVLHKRYLKDTVNSVLAIKKKQHCNCVLSTL